MSSAKPRDALPPSGRSLFFTQSLPVVTLLNLALAARLYEMLGRQPAFFVVRRAEAIDLIALAAIFSFLLPAAVAVCVWGIGLAWRPLGQAAFALVVAAAMTAVVLPLVVRSRGSPSALLWTGLAGGLLAAGAYFRFAAVRRLVAFLWPATLLLPGLFLFASPAARVLQWTSWPPLLDVKETRPAPVVFIILDECCGLTLLDDRGRIDRGRFPTSPRWPTARRGSATRRRCRPAPITPSPASSAAIIPTGRWPRRWASSIRTTSSPCWARTTR